jgi:hypothetical protein
MCDFTHERLIEVDPYGSQYAIMKPSSKQWREPMKKEIVNDTSCEACGSWEFECREDGECYCNSCALPIVKKDDE